MGQDSRSDAPKTGVDRWRDAAKDTKARGSKPKGSGKRAGGLSSAARGHVGALVVMLALCAACAVAFTPVGEKITQGLDIQGGVSVILSASKSDGTQPTSEDMQTATSIVQSRVNALGASEATVQQQGASSILVQIPGATDATSTVEAIGQTGHLEFVRLDDIGDAEALAKIQAGTQNVKLEEGTYTAFLDGSSITRTQVTESQTSVGTYVVNVTFDSAGAQTFSDVTRELAPTKGRIAIVLDGVVNSAPAVQSQIDDGEVSISGSFTAESAQALKTALDSGSLPVTLTYSESRAVGPHPRPGLPCPGHARPCGWRGRRRLLPVLLLSRPGPADTGLPCRLCRAVPGASRHAVPLWPVCAEPAGLAGIVLTTGSAADSSILVLERFREEVRMGRTVRNASVSGTSHGIRTSLDADVVTLITALALLVVATGDVRGFGLTLALGVVCDVVTMFLFKAPALRLLSLGAIQKAPGFWGISQDLAEAQRKADVRTSVTRVQKGGEANA